MKRLICISFLMLGLTGCFEPRMAVAVDKVSGKWTCLEPIETGFWEGLQHGQKYRRVNCREVPIGKLAKAIYVDASNLISYGSN